MIYYTTFGEIQQELRDYYFQNGTGLQFPEAISHMQLHGRLSETPPPQIPSHRQYSQMSDEEFDHVVDRISLSVHSDMSLTESVIEDQIIPSRKDVFVIRHPRYTRPCLHRHDYVEINCVTKGTCLFHFEDTVQELDSGALCLVAPQSRHDIQIQDESTVFCFMLRRSTFETTFYSLLSREDALSLFFRNILRGSREPNYLIFPASNQLTIRFLAQNALLECYESDSYSNSCCISFLNLILADFLRNSGASPRYYHYQMSSNFYLVLQYIRQHYRSLTLSELADQFHYSKPHMCTLIRQNTGLSFTALIRRIRMKRAVEYLTGTELSVARIAEITGYNSSDHFSRVFRGEFSCSPLEYRKRNTPEGDRFVPFEMK